MIDKTSTITCYLSHLYVIVLILLLQPRLITRSKTLFLYIVFLIVLAVAVYNFQVGMNLDKNFKEDQMFQCEKLAYNDCQNLITQLNALIT